MTQDDIIRMVREAAHPEAEDPVNNGAITLMIDEMEHFAALVAAAAKAEEREACAKTVEQIGKHGIVTQCAAAIRARSQQ